MKKIVPFEFNKWNGQELCTRDYDLHCEIIDTNVPCSPNTGRHIKYAVHYDDGTVQYLYCDENGLCNSNKYIYNRTTHDLMMAIDE